MEAMGLPEISRFYDLASVGEVVAPVWETWTSSCAAPRVYRTTGVLASRGRRYFRAGGFGVVPSMTLGELIRALSAKRDGGVSGDLGIDLAVRWGEVKKLFYAGGFTGTLQREGIDPEDFLQEVYRGLLRRNTGTCPWDAKKSSFGHYVHIVMSCVLSNYLRKDRRRTSMESVTDDGLVAGEQGSEDSGTYGVTHKARPSAGIGVPAQGGGEDFTRSDLVRSVFPADKDYHQALSLVGHLEEGLSRKEAAAEMGLSLSVVDSLLRRLRSGLTG